MDDSDPQSILSRLVPVDTKDQLGVGQKQLHKMRDKAVLSSRQTMQKATVEYGELAILVSTVVEGEVKKVRECAEGLRGQSKTLLRLLQVHTSVNTKDKSSTNELLVDQDVKVIEGLDELHECIAVHNHDRAVEAIDRLLQIAPDSTRLHLYMTVLKQTLLKELADNCMDPSIVAHRVTLLQQLSSHQDARDCLLSAYSTRIRTLSTACYRSPLLLARTVGKAIRHSVSLLKRSFGTREAALGGSVVVWAEAHALEIVEKVKGAVKNDQEAKMIIEQELMSGLLSECNIDLHFLLPKDGPMGTNQ